MMKKLLFAFLATFITIGSVLAQNGEIYGGPAPQQLIATTNTSPPTNTTSTADGTLFPTIAPGSSWQNSFTFTSTVGTNLYVTAGAVTGPDAAYFTVGAPSPTVLPGLSSSTFTVTFSPDAGATTGLKEAYIRINAGSGPVNPTVYYFRVEGTVGAPAPVILVTDEQPVIVDNGGESAFGDAQGGCETVVKTYTIANDGTAPLTINDIYSYADWDNDGVIDNDGTYVVTATGLPVTIPATDPNSTYTFTVEFIPQEPNTGAEPDAYYTDFIMIDTETDNPDGSFSDATDFYFYATGTGITPTANMVVYGNSEAIPGDDSNVPNVSSTNDTYFGNVNVNDATGVTHTFTIVNEDACLDLNLTNLSSLVEITGTNASDFVVTLQPSTPVSNQEPNNTTTFEIRFIPSDSGTRTAQVNIASNSSTNPYVFDIAGEGNPILTEPEIDLFDNLNNPLATGGSVDFGQADITSGSVAYTFTIENNGGVDLSLTDPSPYVVISGADAADFVLTAVPSSPIVASGSTTFEITFDPTGTLLTTRTATVSIANNDTTDGEDPYTFTITGEAIDGNADAPLLITQYYHNLGADTEHPTIDPSSDPSDDSSWIEIKNISQQTVFSGQYYLALYDGINSSSSTIDINPPTASVAIPTLSPGDVVLFKKASSSLPINGNFTNVISTSACNFDGNDVILISSSNQADCYDKRIDIVGVVAGGSPPLWGVDKAFIKGCGTTEQPSLTFDATTGVSSVIVNDYIEVTLDEVNNAVSGTNMELGTQSVGPTSWTTSWDNGVPDETKVAVINGTYTAADGTFETCNLLVSASGSIVLDGGTTNYIHIYNDLTVNGNLTIGDTESLVTDEYTTVSGSITKLETTTPLNNYFDYTYWSSPVSTTIESAFSGVNPNNIYEWRKPANGDGYGFWDPASGSMTAAKGYIAIAPSSTPDGGTYTASFSGVPHSGLISIALGVNDDGNPDTDFNLIGNPYPAAVDIDEFIEYSNGPTNNAAMDGTIWLWTHNTAVDASGEFLGDDYATYNLSGGVVTASAAGSGGSTPTNNIGSGQGFFVRASSANNVWFNNTMILPDQNDQFFRGTDTKKSATEEKDRIWLNMESKTGGAFNQLLVGFFENATEGVDRGYDGLKLSGGWISFYSKINENKYAIQGLGSFGLDKTVTLGFDTYIEDAMTYVISIDHMEGALKSSDIYLVDNELNITHDLNEGPYEFSTTGSGNFENRLTLQFTKATLDVEDIALAENDFVVSNLDTGLNVRSSNVIADLKVYDLTGRLLINKTPNSTEVDITTKSIRRGTVLIINATFDTGAEVSKKAIRY